VAVRPSTEHVTATVRERQTDPRTKTSAELRARTVYGRRRRRPRAFLREDTAAGHVLDRQIREAGVAETEDATPRPSTGADTKRVQGVVDAVGREEEEARDSEIAEQHGPEQAQEVGRAG
jgi:hypothetical protein